MSSQPPTSAHLCPLIDTPTTRSSAICRRSAGLAATAGDLVVHVIADAEVVRGTLGAGETSVSIASDGLHSLGDGDASLWISTKLGASPTTTVSSSGWPSSPAPSPRVMNGVGLVQHGAGPDIQPPTAPGSFLATALNASQVNLSWIASTDNVGGHGVSCRAMPR